MKKSVVVISTLLMLSTFTGFASAAPDSTRIAPTQLETSTDSREISLFDVSHIGSHTFQNSFHANIHAGKRLDVDVKNDGSGTVFMTLMRDGEYYAVDIPISPGQQKTETINVYGGFISEKWKVFINTKDGHNMDIQVSARQY
ncbi:hypothetical protein AZ66_16450 [Paenibacillus sp. E194]|uniref:hypothetical protein n=1 Tax=Paenibacillus sp. E194 TaxID=1458845 RepID=UPI0005CB6CA5|nr:hypothetical protein [Paenibacillus sp. E194]KJB86863.1 hypothetical protein AZ66_16450 [Paenibacillus sp. E194]